MKAPMLGIVLVLTSAAGVHGTEPSTPAEHYRALIREWQDSVAKAEAEASAGKSGTWLCDELNRIKLRIDKRALRFARNCPRDPAALDALLWVAAGEGAHRDTIGEALDLLLRDHIASERFAPACDRAFLFGWFTSPASVDRFLRAALDQNSRRDVRGRACFGLARFLDFQAQSIRAMETDPEARAVVERLLRTPEVIAFWRARTSDDLAKEAEGLFERVAEEFADVKDGEGGSLGGRAEGELFQRRELVIGKLAPKIEGRDADGRGFRLSDYRGKVVVLTFSGNWCGPCVGMYPQERELVARMKGEPFALVSVSTDADVETLKTSIATGEITWRCWWDGGKMGPITTRWGISGFPSIFVLDKSGVIRFKDVRGEEMDKAVASLLREEPSEIAPKR